VTLRSGTSGQVDAEPADALLDADQLTAIGATVRARLARNSADYRAALGEDPRAATIEIVQHRTATGPFEVNATRIKRRYLIPAPAPRIDRGHGGGAIDPTTGLVVPAQHLPVLREALRAPSAHNAQPWRLVITGSDPQDGTATYELHYDHTDYLPYDPDDRDAYLCLGTDLHVVDLTLRPAVDRPDPTEVAMAAMAAMAADRHTNRSTYTHEALPPELTAALEDLGCVLISPGRVARLVDRASALSWQDRRFVADLERFCHADPSAPCGMTPQGLMLAGYEWLLLRLAFRLGRLPGPIGRLYSSRDVRLLRSAPSVAVLGADCLEPQALLHAGRRLLRAWALISGSGWAYHPISIAVDRPETTPQVAELSGIAVPAAVFRIGRPSRPAPRSNRVDLSRILGPVPTIKDPTP
jgi:hypothetical protein